MDPQHHHEKLIKRGRSMKFIGAANLVRITIAVDFLKNFDIISEFNSFINSFRMFIFNHYNHWMIKLFVSCFSLAWRSFV